MGRTFGSTQGAQSFSGPGWCLGAPNQDSAAMNFQGMECLVCHSPVKYQYLRGGVVRVQATLGQISIQTSHISLQNIKIPTKCPGQSEGYKTGAWPWRHACWGVSHQHPGKQLAQAKWSWALQDLLCFGLILLPILPPCSYHAGWTKKLACVITLQPL